MSLDKNAWTSHPDSFWSAFVRMCKRLECDPVALGAVINSESAFDPHAQNFAAGADKPAVAKGLNQLIHKTATDPNGIVRMSEDEWTRLQDMSATDQLVYVERYFGGKSGTAARGKTKGQLYRMNFGGFNNPDGSLYASKAYQASYIEAHPDAVFAQSDYQQKALDQNKGLSSDGGQTIRQLDLDRLVSNLPSKAIQAKIEAAISRVNSGDEDKEPDAPSTPDTPDAPKEGLSTGAKVGIGAFLLTIAAAVARAVFRWPF